MQVGSSTSSHLMWTRQDDKDFDKAIAKLGVIDSEGKWYKIAFLMPTKTIEELKKRYKLLVEDISDIEGGLVPIPNHNWRATTTTSKDYHSRTKQERKRGIPWTKEEHELFLLGMEQYGRGDWRSISRYVKSRTPTQVASHAQKYFIHLDSKKNKRRSSIHDVTIENTTGVVSTHQDPITGQQFTNESGAHVVGSGAMANQMNPPTVHDSSLYGGPTGVHPPGGRVYRGQSVGHPPGVVMYGGATVGNPPGIGMYQGQFVGHEPGAVPASVFGTSIIQPTGHHPTYIPGQDLHQITNDVPRFVQNNYYSSF